MTTIGIGDGATWAPEECTLPTAARPLRVAEFDRLFAAALRSVQRVGPTRLRLVLDGASETDTTARDLAARESECCSFFSFEFANVDDELTVDVIVPVVHANVLDALSARALAAAEAGTR